MHTPTPYKASAVDDFPRRPAFNVLTGAFKPHRGDESVHDCEECRVSATTYLAWSAAVGVAGCGRCATAA